MINEWNGIQMINRKGSTNENMISATLKLIIVIIIILLICWQQDIFLLLDSIQFISFQSNSIQFKPIQFNPIQSIDGRQRWWMNDWCPIKINWFQAAFSISQHPNAVQNFFVSFCLLFSVVHFCCVKQKLILMDGFKKDKQKTFTW